LPLILSIQNYNPLSLYTFRLASSYQFKSACACGLILMLVGSSCFIFKGIYQFIKEKSNGK
jgi:ABC-type Fe3+ transport system permease subunit